MSQPYVGEIRLFPYNFAPNGWFDCDGRLLSIAEYEVLYTLLGTTYGGDGVNTFGLPNLCGRVPIHQGTGLGMGTYVLGQLAGTEQVTLISSQMPAHTHVFNAVDSTGSSNTPAANLQLGAVAEIRSTRAAPRASTAPTWHRPPSAPPSAASPTTTPCLRWSLVSASHGLASSRRRVDAH